MYRLKKAKPNYRSPNGIRPLHKDAVIPDHPHPGYRYFSINLADLPAQKPKPKKTAKP